MQMALRRGRRRTLNLLLNRLPPKTGDHSAFSTRRTNMSRYLSITLSGLTLALLAQSASAEEAIAYRLSDWHEMHFEDPVKAEQHLAAVRKLGCEVRQDAHDGHVDVVYRSARWQALEVASDELAHQWEDWLKGSGFETLHGHAADHAGHDHAG